MTILFSDAAKKWIMKLKNAQSPRTMYVSLWVSAQWASTLVSSIERDSLVTRGARHLPLPRRPTRATAPFSTCPHANRPTGNYTLSLRGRQEVYSKPEKLRSPQRKREVRCARRV